jgi:hypothetical protein
MKKRNPQILFYLSSFFDRFLTVAEQMVTYYHSVDMTDKLTTDGYWASYNNVYFPDFRDISGEEKQVTDKGPELYSWANSSRARIFQRDQGNITNLDSMIRMMRLIKAIFI